VDASVTEKLAAWITSVGWDDIPERVKERARWQTASVVAAIHASHHSPAARSVRDAVRSWEKSGRCTSLAGGPRMARDEAVLVDSAYSMALDYDDYLYMGHTGHSAVLASLAIGEASGRSAKDVLVAQVIANEVGGRLGASAVLGPQNGQAWSFIHALEAAAIGAKLYDLDAERTAHALGIALYQPGFTLWPGFMGPGSKVLTAAQPTIAGMQAADFAKHGLTGARRVIEHEKKGFWAAFSYAPLPQMMTGFGAAWVSDTLAFKRYPGCAYVDTALDAMLEILGRREIGVDDVRSIDVRASLLTVEMDNLSDEHDDGARLSPINVNFSLSLNLAIAIVAGTHEGRVLDPAFLSENERTIRALASLVRVEHDWDATFEVVRAFEGVLGKSGALAALRPTEYASILAGYRRQMGGKKKTDVRAADLFARVPKLLAAFLEKPSSEGVRDLSSVDFTRFRMAFPVTVTLTTTSGEQLTARQDVPIGAPGQSGMLDAVREKFLREVRIPEREAALAAILDFENQLLSELIPRVAVPSETR
jgi:2-methylcitrate dehydratase PrpD